MASFFGFGGMPGGSHFPGGIPGGIPGGFPGAVPSRGNVDNQRLYDILGVKRTASDEELRKSHRQLALKYHPDKGGDAEKFKELNYAYNILKDPQKRKVYDEHGEDVVKDIGEGGQDPDMSSMFGGAFPGMRRPDGRPQPTVSRMEVSLKDLYNGVTKRLAIQRKVNCQTCKGTGSKSGHKPKCSNCKGKGVTVATIQIGPGMLQHVQQACHMCQQTGFGKPTDPCANCKGESLVSDKRTIELHIPPGSRHGHKLVKHGEAGISKPGGQPADLIFVVQQKEDPNFQRLNDDLILTHRISLVEALTGVQVTFDALDDRRLTFSSPTGYVIKPGTSMRIADEGMPKESNSFIKGNLYVQFDIVFPDTLPTQATTGLLDLLPNIQRDKVLSPDSNTDEVTAEPVADLREELRTRQDDEHDDEHGQQHVQCAQQ